MSNNFGDLNMSLKIATKQLAALGVNVTKSKAQTFLAVNAKQDTRLSFAVDITGVEVDSESFDDRAVSGTDRRIANAYEGLKHTRLDTLEYLFDRFNG